MNFFHHLLEAELNDSDILVFFTLPVDVGKILAMSGRYTVERGWGG